MYDACSHFVLSMMLLVVITAITWSEAVPSSPYLKVHKYTLFSILMLHMILTYDTIDNNKNLSKIEKACTAINEKMKPTLWLLGLLAVTSSTTTAALINIQSASLTRTNRNCDGSTVGAPMTETFGTVQVSRVINQLVAVPVLLKGTPNTAYSVRLIQIKNGAAVSCPPCPAGQTLTTNNAGVGYTNVQQSLTAGATGAWVAVNKKSNCNDFFTTPVVPIP